MGDQSDEHGWGWDAAADVVGVLSGVALASAGINEIVLRLTDRDRIRRAAPIVSRRRRAALDDARLVARDVASTAAVVVPRAATNVDDAFRVPQTEASRSLMARLRESLREAEDRAKVDASAASHVAEEARRVYPQANLTAARCAASLDAIGTLRPDLGLKLADAATYLVASVRDVEASATSGKPGGHVAALNVAALSAVERVLEALDAAHVVDQEKALILPAISGPGQPQRPRRRHLRSSSRSLALACRGMKLLIEGAGVIRSAA